MQERHPIDDRFRQVLANAEADPPARVWAAIASAQSDRRKAGAWPWYNYVGAALIGAGLLGTAVHYLSDHQSTNPKPSLSVLKPDMEEDRSAVPPSTSNPEPEGEPGSADRTASSQKVEDDGRTSASSHQAMERSARKGTPSGNVDGPVRSGKAELQPYPEQEGTNAPPMASIEGGSGVQNAPLPASTFTMEPAVREEMDLLSPILRSEFLRGTISGASPQNYVLPHGEWWLGAQWSTYSVHSDWTGSDEELAAALDEGEGNGGTQAWGILFGRQWQSGFGVSSGLVMDRVERSLRYVEDRTTTTEEITSFFVTLNNEVFVSDVDTVRTTTLDEQVTEGIDRRTMVRIPVLGHWSHDLRRWSIGIQAGVALELTRTEAGPGLVRTESGTIEAVYLDAETRSQRYPDVVLGIAGIDLGYRLHERWSLQAGYVGMRGLTTLSEKGPVQASPIRHGAEIRLRFHLPARTRP